MLVDLLDQSIIAMKEIYELEKSSNDVQKQEKNDKIFSNVVSENHLMVKAVTNSMSQLGFVISQETRGKVIGLLKSSSDAVSRGLIQESTANYLQKEVFNIKKAILQEWSDYYHRVADQKINMLQTIKGIAPERQATIFTRFYREPEVHDKEGIGIGLYLAREIITLQNGYIEVQSQIGQGSKFIIYLPNRD